jgi:hypothetical protein
MQRFAFCPCLAGALAALALGGCGMMNSARCSCNRCRYREPPMFAQHRPSGGPTAPAPLSEQAEVNPTQTAAVGQGPSLPLPVVPELATTAAAVGPQLPVQPVAPAVSSAVVKGAPSASREERRSLVGKLEPGAEHGTWNLRCDLESGINPTGSVLKLVSSQPLCGFRTGQQVRVDGYLTSYDRETAFQVEHLTLIPPH